MSHADREQAPHYAWFELEPLHRWYWWLVERRLSWPTKVMWLRKAERGLRQWAERHGLTLLGDPIGVVVRRGSRVVVRASALTSDPEEID